MALVTLYIKDKEDGTGIEYELTMNPVAKSQADLTLAQNIGLVTFDAVQSMLNKYGAETKMMGVPDGKEEGSK